MIKKIRITIAFDIKGDLDDEETLLEDINTYLSEAIEEGDLEYTAEDLDEDADEDF